MDWLTVAKEVGVPVVILFFVGAAIASFWKWLHPRLDKVIDGHLEMLNTVGNESEKHTAILNAIESNLVTLQDQHTNTDSPFATVRTDAALTHIASAIEEGAPEDSKDRVRQHTVRAREILNPHE